MIKLHTAQRWALATLAALMAGCTTVYTPKPGEPTTRVRLVFPVDGTRSHDFGILALDACPARPPMVANNSVTPRKAASLGMPTPPGAGTRLFTEMLIPANKPLFIALASASFSAYSSVRCEVPLRFESKAGVDYEFEYVTLAAAEKCLVSVRSAPKGSGRWRRESNVRKVPPDPTGKYFHDFCGASAAAGTPGVAPAR